jgi:hypothetical protein
MRPGPLVLWVTTPLGGSRWQRAVSHDVAAADGLASVGRGMHVVRELAEDSALVYLRFGPPSPDGLSAKALAASGG